MRYILFKLIFLSLLISAKSQTYNSPNGLTYIIVKGKGGRAIVLGDLVKIDMVYRVKDSIEISTKNTPPLYQYISPYLGEYDGSEMWPKLQVGDSVVMIQHVDKFIDLGTKFYNPRIKRGDSIFTYIKVLDVFPSDSLVQIDKVNEKKKWFEKERNEIRSFLSNKKLKCIETASGAFVEVLNAGKGRLIKSGDSVLVDISMKTIAGKKYYSTKDSTFAYVIPKPYKFYVGKEQVFKCLDEVLVMLRKGALVRVYIPSTLGYGEKGVGSMVLPYEHLICEIDVISINK